MRSDPSASQPVRELPSESGDDSGIEAELAAITRARVQEVQKFDTNEDGFVYPVVAGFGGSVE